MASDNTRLGVAHFYNIGTPEGSRPPSRGETSSPRKEQCPESVEIGARYHALVLEAAEQAFWPSLVNVSPRKRAAPPALVRAGSPSSLARAYEIYSEQCSEDGGDFSDWTVDDGSPRKKNGSPRKIMSPRKIGSPQKRKRMELMPSFQEAQVSPELDNEQLMPSLHEFTECSKLVDSHQTASVASFGFQNWDRALHHQLSPVAESEDQDLQQQSPKHDETPKEDVPKVVLEEAVVIKAVPEVVPEEVPTVVLEEQAGCCDHMLDLPDCSSHSSSEQQQRKLCDLLWESRPMWKPKDLLNAERKLRKIGIESTEALTASLSPACLNEKLQESGEQPFTKAAIREFTKRLVSTAEDSQGDDRSSLTKERVLLDLLWEARPLWTPSDLVAADRKLTKIGVDCVVALRDALASTGGINEKLREVDAKAFNSDTVRALRRCMKDGRQQLRMLLEEARPLWTPQEVAGADRKLAKVGVDCVIALSEALKRGGGDLKRRLQDAGFKGFTVETTSALRHQLEIMYSANVESGGA